MRKRLVIGAIAAVVIGVAAYILSLPRKGTVEYHKRQYLAVRTPPLWVYKDPVPGVVRSLYWHRWNTRRNFHRTALLEAGYLRHAMVPVTNSAPRNIKVEDALRCLFTQDTLEFTTMVETQPDALWVVAPSEMIAQIAQVIRKADVPETK